MSIEIVYDPESEQAVLYCNTANWAFGHVFYPANQNGWNLDAQEAAQSFLSWHNHSFRRGPRGLSEETFERRFMAWQAAFSEDIEGEEVCAECESPHHRTTHCPQRD